MPRKPYQGVNFTYQRFQYLEITNLFKALVLLKEILLVDTVPAQ